MAVTANTRSPQITGLELAMPGIGVFHLMFFPLAISHSVTARWPSPLPEAPSPRNAGQLRGPVDRGIDAAAAGGAATGSGAAAAAAASGVMRARLMLAGP